ncbi:hypothetical protein GQ600_12119 [Phytophthora cactorum]|nr:hypothetical protein GQ600_12119 [Phytophthora cactorum]
MSNPGSNSNGTGGVMLPWPRLAFAGGGHNIQKTRVDPIALPSTIGLLVHDSRERFILAEIERHFPLETKATDRVPTRTWICCRRCIMCFDKNPKQ